MTSLGETGRRTFTERFGDETLTLSELELEDYALAAEYLTSCRSRAFLDRIRSVPLPDDVISKTLADIETRTVPITDVLSCTRGSVFLIWRAAVKNDPTLALKKMFSLFPSHERTMDSIVRAIMGLGQGDGTENPTTSSPESLKNTSET